MKEYIPALVPQDAPSLPAFLTNELGRLGDTLGLPQFLAPTLLNSWVNFGTGWAPAGFYKDGLGRVHFRGVIKDGTTTANTPLFTLPLGFRPSGHLIFSVPSNSAFGCVQVMSTGSVQVRVANAAWLSLDGISFAAQ